MPDIVKYPRASVSDSGPSGKLRKSPCQPGVVRHDGDGGLRLAIATRTFTGSAGMKT